MGVRQSSTMTNIRPGRAISETAGITYEVLGDQADDPLVLISGLGSQMVYWTDELCQVFLELSLIHI